MAGYYDSIDLAWDLNGDFNIDDRGDLADTSSDTIRSTENEIRDIIRSSLGDWELHPGRAAELKEFAGRPNTRDVGKEIETRLRSALVVNRIAAADDIYVRVVPVRYDAVLIILTLDVYATPTNRLETGDPLVISTLMDIAEGSLAFIEQKKVENFFPVGE